MDEPEDLRSIEEAVRGRYAGLERRVYRPDLLEAVVAPRQRSSSRALWLGSAAVAAAVVTAMTTGAVLLGPGRHVADLSAGTPSKPASTIAPPTPSSTGRSSLAPTSPPPTGTPPPTTTSPPTTTPARLSGVAALVQQGPLGQAALLMLAALPPQAQLESGVAYRPTALDTTRMPTAEDAQVCDSMMVGPVTNPVWPVAGTTAMAWTGTGAGATAGDWVSFTITKWAGGADAGWRQLVTNTGPCQWLQTTPQPWPGRDTNNLLARSNAGDPPFWVAMEHVGAYVVSVAYHGADASHVRSEAMRLADIVAANLRARG